MSGAAAPEWADQLRTFLARAGCRVGIVDKDRNRAEKVAGDLAASGATVFHVVADATDEQQVDKAVRAVEDALGPIDRMATVIGIGVWSRRSST